MQTATGQYVVLHERPYNNVRTLQHLLQPGKLESRVLETKNKQKRAEIIISNTVKKGNNNYTARATKQIFCELVRGER
jgi:hypothetical protein